ncbi:hypothetical protein SAMN05428988_4295 [Chitinophaga sp. YR573]|uniref:hypothetical protein n=1 Tax=Chitinophaga sp. YR573 TaxID=1881040 RepID=UPI0008D456BB|nr:hypothetical protein [Chitinophaga sp. YR573]SEW35205.1 hypothetical protein SAMN05428988_4295 [Chitinophaga sp. YR573]
MKILIRDETLSGKITQEFRLELDTSGITIRELIRSRVYEDVKAFNSNGSIPYMGLVQPRAEELLLNPVRSNGVAKKDPAEQVDLALKAFDKNGFLLLINNKQYTDPDETVRLQPDATISFIKLVPLVGG